MRRFLALALAVALPAAIPFVGIQAAQAMVHHPVHKVVHKPVHHAAGKYNLADGKTVFVRNCATCHGSLAARKPVLPNAANFFAGKLRLTHGNPAMMQHLITVGGAGFGHGASPTMPAWGHVLSAKQIADVAAFERSLHR